MKNDRPIHRGRCWQMRPRLAGLPPLARPILTVAVSLSRRASPGQTECARCACGRTTRPSSRQSGRTAAWPYPIRKRAYRHEMVRQRRRRPRETWHQQQVHVEAVSEVRVGASVRLETEAREWVQVRPCKDKNVMNTLGHEQGRGTDPLKDRSPSRSGVEQPQICQNLEHCTDHPSIQNQFASQGNVPELRL